MKKETITDKDQSRDSLNNKLDNIIKQTRTENQALRKIIEGLEIINEKSKKSFINNLKTTK